jgi:hypothetical protein
MGRCTLENSTQKSFVTRDAPASSASVKTTRRNAVTQHSIRVKVPTHRPKSATSILTTAFSSLSCILDVNICSHVASVICGGAGKSAPGEWNLAEENQVRREQVCEKDFQ